MHSRVPAAHKVPNLPALRVLAAETDRISRLSGAETALLVGVDRRSVDPHRRSADDPASRRCQFEQPRTAGIRRHRRAVHPRPGHADRRHLRQRLHGSLCRRERARERTQCAFRGAQPRAADHARPRRAVRDHQRFRRARRSVHAPPSPSIRASISAVPGVRRSAPPRPASLSSPAPAAVTEIWSKSTMATVFIHGTVIFLRYWYVSERKFRKALPSENSDRQGAALGPTSTTKCGYDDVVRDPSRFIEAGRHVLQ